MTDDTEYGSIEREITVAATPEVVFDVVSKPEHIRRWWPDDARFDAAPGGAGELVFGDPAAGEAKVERLTVVEVDRPRLFSFLWAYGPGVEPDRSNAFFVTFELAPVTGGTLVHLTETGFRERGWEVAVLEQNYRDHVNGWDHFVPRLGDYVASLVSAS